MRRVARRRAHAWAITSNTSAETNVAGPPGGGISAAHRASSQNPDRLTEVSSSAVGP